ncbi:hypothetical protein KAW80_03765 [Candidatus Babeliales bacterium]|nr:hypothetical protein [Candidatus Babeliales bacterium]
MKSLSKILFVLIVISFQKLNSIIIVNNTCHTIYLSNFKAINSDYLGNDYFKHRKIDSFLHKSLDQDLNIDERIINPNESIDHDLRNLVTVGNKFSIHHGLHSTAATLSSLLNGKQTASAILAEVSVGAFPDNLYLYVPNLQDRIEIRYVDNGSKLVANYMVAGSSIVSQPQMAATKIIKDSLREAGVQMYPNSSPIINPYNFLREIKLAIGQIHVQGDRKDIVEWILRYGRISRSEKRDIIAYTLETIRDQRIKESAEASFEDVLRKYENPALDNYVPPTKDEADREVERREGGTWNIGMVPWLQ